VTLREFRHEGMRAPYCCFGISKHAGEERGPRMTSGAPIPPYNQRPLFSLHPGLEG
jgi:hypothetical protein